MTKNTVGPGEKTRTIEAKTKDIHTSKLIFSPLKLTPKPPSVTNPLEAFVMYLLYSLSLRMIQMIT
jgi:hypothetical protein